MLVQWGGRMRIPTPQSTRFKYTKQNDLFSDKANSNPFLQQWNSSHGTAAMELQAPLEINGDYKRPGPDYSQQV